MKELGNAYDDQGKKVSSWCPAQKRDSSGTFNKTHCRNIQKEYLLYSKRPFLDTLQNRKKFKEKEILTEFPAF